MTEENYGYVLQPGESIVTSDEVACLLVYKDGEPVKLVWPNGEVEAWHGTAGSKALH